MRPPLPAPDLAQGLLRAVHFQMAYAVSDMDLAQAMFADRYGVRNWFRLEGALPAGGHMCCALAWAGGLMIELMHAGGPGSAIYMDRLPQGEGLRIRHHHLGYWLEDEAQWEALMAQVAAGGHALPHVSLNTGLMKSCFVEAPLLGHYLEFICPEAAGRALFEKVPVN